MPLPRTGLGLTAMALTAGALISACSGGSVPAASTSSSTKNTVPMSAPVSTAASPASTAASPSSSAQMDPNAPESNPPGDIPDNQAFVTYSPPGGAFSVKVPEGWSRSTSGSSAVFTDKLNSIRLESRPAGSAPTAGSARDQELPDIVKSGTNVAAGDVTTVTRKAGPAVRITYQADSAADPVTGKTVRDAVERYEFWHAGTEAVLTLSGPRGADNVDPWRTVTDSFTWR